MPNEPVTRLMGCCTKAGYRIYNLDNLLREMLYSQTCFMAKNKESAIVGVVFCNVISKPNEPIDICPTKTEYIKQGWPDDFAHILLLLDQLGYHPKIMLEKKVHQLFDIFAVVVKPEYQQQGLATQLITKALTKAQSLKIPLVTITCTSTFTQRCCNKLGFEIENMIRYENWFYEGKQIFNNIDPAHPAIISYVKYMPSISP